MKDKKKILSETNVMMETKWKPPPPLFLHLPVILFRGPFVSIPQKGRQVHSVTLKPVTCCHIDKVRKDKAAK